MYPKYLTASEAKAISSDAKETGALREIIKAITKRAEEGFVNLEIAGRLNPVDREAIISLGYKTSTLFNGCYTATTITWESPSCGFHKPSLFERLNRFMNLREEKTDLIAGPEIYTTRTGKYFKAQTVREFLDSLEDPNR